MKRYSPPMSECALGPGHTETSCGATLEEEARHVQQLQVHALQTDVLIDIRYNFLVGATGYVFEGRGWRYRSAFARGYDLTRLGVVFMGNFKTKPPTPEAVEAFHQLMALGEREGHLSPDWRAMAQCQLVTTDSPGRALYQLLKGWPRWAGPSPSEITGLLDMDVVSREKWLANPPARPIPKLECPVRVVVICHTGTTAPKSVERERRQMRSLQDFEVHCRGRADLPFNFVLAPSGAVYEGRGWALAADLRLLGRDLELDVPDDGNGRRCLAVALLGTFCRGLPASPALDALPYLLAEAERRRVLTQDYCVVGHCQLAPTNSPGGALFSLLKTWPRWIDRPFDDGGRDAAESDSA
ncbi:peptidoglycan-recognition protein LF-like [Schistocerca serialis cubense]|uniref:peptidoglycan-recognition protein LF-like n=1 Tax=Schistocerca serialis cubense TaxID=2023355 RepID=UPI00214EC536|nr:peptidoglycan-recognition protein LF-like [Schistocerca serialis cubense]